MNAKFLENVRFLFTFDKEYKTNLIFIKENNLLHKFENEVSANNLNKIIFLSGLAFVMTLYMTFMDYVSNYAAFDEQYLNVYRIIDPVYAIISLFIYILSRFAKTYNKFEFTQIVIHIFIFISVVNYAMVSSIEQFDFKHHPSFVFTILLISVLITSQTYKVIIYYVIGVFIILYFCRFFKLEQFNQTVSWSVTIFAFPLSVITTKVNYNHIIKIFVDKIKLESINKDLEDKIEIRTKELEEINDQLKNQLEMQDKYKHILEVARDKAERSDRLKTAFLSNLSHEIRTPLNSIIGFSSLLNNPKIDIEKTRRYTGLINSCGKELVFIIDQLVEMSKIESGEIEINKLYFMVNDLLFEVQEKTLERLRELKKDHISFSIDNPCYERNIRLYTDLIKIKQIIYNLVENSIKFTDNGKIEVGFDLQPDKDLIFYIKDTGIGIGDKDKEILFEQFSQGNSGISRKYGGLGLGLAITKTYVEMLKGKIWFESEEGSGTVFYIRIPIH